MRRRRRCVLPGAQAAASECALRLAGDGHRLLGEQRGGELRGARRRSGRRCRRDGPSRRLGAHHQLRPRREPGRASTRQRHACRPPGRDCAAGGLRRRNADAAKGFGRRRQSCAITARTAACRALSRRVCDTAVRPLAAHAGCGGMRAPRRRLAGGQRHARRAAVHGQHGCGRRAKEGLSARRTRRATARAPARRRRDRPALIGASGRYRRPRRRGVVVRPGASAHDVAGHDGGSGARRACAASGARGRALPRLLPAGRCAARLFAGRPGVLQGARATQRTRRARGWLGSGVRARRVVRADALPPQVNSLVSAKSALPIEYYSLPFCRPAKIVSSAENLGEARPARAGGDATRDTLGTHATREPDAPCPPVPAGAARRPYLQLALPGAPRPPRCASPHAAPGGPRAGSRSSRRCSLPASAPLCCAPRVGGQGALSHRRARRGEHRVLRAGGDGAARAAWLRGLPRLCCVATLDGDATPRLRLTRACAVAADPNALGRVVQGAVQVAAHRGAGARLQGAHR